MGSAAASSVGLGALGVAVGGRLVEVAVGVFVGTGVGVAVGGTGVDVGGTGVEVGGIRVGVGAGAGACSWHGRTGLWRW